MNLKLILLIICGAFWSITYIAVARKGLKDKTYAMPFLALSLNFSWEVYNTIQGYLFAGFHLSTKINIVWTLLDMLILYTYFKYGNKELGKDKKTFYLYSISILLVSFCLQHYISYKLGLIQGAVYAGFWINLLMSILFIRMFYKRSNLEGQSLLIASAKCIGTLAITILVGVLGINRLGGKIDSIMYIGFITFIIDFYYVYLVGKSLKTKN